MEGIGNAVAADKAAGLRRRGKRAEEPRSTAAAGADTDTRMPEAVEGPLEVKKAATG